MMIGLYPLALQLAARLLGLDPDALDVGDRARADLVVRAAFATVARGPRDAYEIECELEGTEAAKEARLYIAVADAWRDAIGSRTLAS